MAEYREITKTNGVDNCPNCPFVNGWGSCRLEDGAPFEWELESEEECE